MNPYVLIIISACIFAGQAVCLKTFSVEYRRGFASHFLNNVFFLGLTALIVLAINGATPAENPATYIYAAVFGGVWVVSMTLYIIALQTGPTGLVTLFFSFGIIIPIIVDIAVLRTLISIFQIGGLILLFLSFYIGNKPKKGERDYITPQFIIVCLVSIVLNGIVISSAKLHQGIMPGIDVNAFVLYGFTVSVIVSAACFLFFHIRQTKKEKVTYVHMFRSPKYYGSMAGASITTAVGNVIMVLVAGQVPAVIQFPLALGGTSIITAILSVFIFKERITKMTALIFALGIAALVIINL